MPIELRLESRFIQRDAETYFQLLSTYDILAIQCSNVEYLLPKGMTIRILHKQHVLIVDKKGDLKFTGKFKRRHGSLGKSIICPHYLSPFILPN